jgi:predicted permease
MFTEWLTRARLKLNALLRRKRLDRDLDDELAFHLQMREEKLGTAGKELTEAHFEALRQFGNATSLKERTRGMWTFSWLEDFWQDIRFGARMLRKNPGVAVVAIVTLAFGIGVNTTIFSLVDGLLLRKPPVHDADRVMLLLSRNPAGGWAADRRPVSPPDFLDWRESVTSFTEIAAADSGEATLSGSSQPERLTAGRVSANYFQLLDVSPLLGRTFSPGEDQPGHDRVALLGEGLWRRRFGADPQIIGRPLRIDGQDYVVIGVMPSRLQLWMMPAQVWTPLVFSPEQLSAAARSSRSLLVFGRLKPQMEQNQAGAELAAIASRIAQNHSESEKGWGANVMSLQQYMIADANAKPAIVTLMATVGFVLLIACANLANLLLARNSARQHEFAIRASLGAGRFRLARQLLSECLLLSLFGGSLGLAVAFLGLDLLRGNFNWNEYAAAMASTLSIDRGVLLFTILVSVITAAIFGLIPAIQMSRRDANAVLKGGSRTMTAGRERSRLQSIFVVVELALSVILLAGAGLFIKSFLEETQASLGVNPGHLLTASVTLAGNAYKDPSRQIAFFDDVMRQVRSFPEVQSAAVTTSLPVSFEDIDNFQIEGRAPTSANPSEHLQAGYYAVTPGYFETAQIPLIEGRVFTSSDDSSSLPVALVNQAFARKYFPGGDPLGRRIHVGAAAATAKWSEIVGVVGDVLEIPGQTPHRPQIYEPFFAHPSAAMCIVVRTSTRPGAFADSLRGAIRKVDQDQAVAALKTMAQVVNDANQGDGLMAGMMGSFAGLAMLMAAIGIYGVLGYSVGQRTHEIGIRMALGAERGEVLRLIMRDALRLILVGVGIGVSVSLALPLLLSAGFEFFHVDGGKAIAVAPVMVMIVALASCYLPARRAAHVDPMVALRHE